MASEEKHSDEQQAAELTHIPGRDQRALKVGGLVVTGLIDVCAVDWKEFPEISDSADDTDK